MTDALSENAKLISICQERKLYARTFIDDIALSDSRIRIPKLSSHYPSRSPSRGPAALDLTEIALTLLQLESTDSDRVALRGPFAVIKVVEASAQTLIENVRATESQGLVATDGESGSVDSTGLRRVIELKLEIGCNISSAALGILEDAVVNGNCEFAFLVTGDHFLI